MFFRSSRRSPSLAISDSRLVAVRSSRYATTSASPPGHSISLLSVGLRGKTDSRSRSPQSQYFAREDSSVSVRRPNVSAPTGTSGVMTPNRSVGPIVRVRNVTTGCRVEWEPATVVWKMSR